MNECIVISTKVVPSFDSIFYSVHWNGWGGISSRKPTCICHSLVPADLTAESSGRTASHANVNSVEVHARQHRRQITLNANNHIILFADLYSMLFNHPTLK